MDSPPVEYCTGLPSFPRVLVEKFHSKSSNYYDYLYLCIFIRAHTMSAIRMNCFFLYVYYCGIEVFISFRLRITSVSELFYMK